MESPDWAVAPLVMLDPHLHFLSCSPIDLAPYCSLGCPLRKPGPLAQSHQPASDLCSSVRVLAVLFGPRWWSWAEAAEAVALRNRLGVWGSAVGCLGGSSQGMTCHRSFLRDSCLPHMEPPLAGSHLPHQCFENDYPLEAWRCQGGLGWRQAPGGLPKDMLRGL